MTRYVQQSELADIFGISLEEMDEILVEHGLKSGKEATQKALNGRYAVLTISPFLPFEWNVIKISELIGKKILDEIDYYVKEVLSGIRLADTGYPNRILALLTATAAYRNVPTELWDKVHFLVSQKIIGDRRETCKKCGRMTFFRYKDFCWQCIPDDPFMRERLDFQAKVREAAAQLAAAGWGTLHIDHILDPRDTDIDLWNGAVDIAIDRFLVEPDNPFEFDLVLAQDIVQSINPQIISMFQFSGFEGNRWLRCAAFLMLAYKTVMEVLVKEAIEPISGS